MATITSCAITGTQSRYAPIEWEALTTQFPCERFHKYIYGKSVQIQTDYKSLATIFQKAMNDYLPWLQCIWLRVQRYDLQISHVPGKSMHAVDALLLVVLMHTADTFENEIGCCCVKICTYHW